MDINAVTTQVTALVTSTSVTVAPVIGAKARTALTIDECKDVMNTLGNCYSCNKPGNVKRNCPDPGQLSGQGPDKAETRDISGRSCLLDQCLTPRCSR